MSSSKKTDPPAEETGIPYHDQIEKFGGGHISSRHGKVDNWLSVVYLILFVWVIYYGFTYWGGLGPGLDY